MIKVNEEHIPFQEGLTLEDLKDRFKPTSDITIYNGFPVSENTVISDGDELIFIQRGEIPSEKELERLMVARHSPGVYEKVKKTVVGIAGLGGLGSSVAIALARMGIGRLVLADFDLVEPSNLNRQQYFVHQIGLSKVNATRDNLAQINPYVEIEIHNVLLNEENTVSIFRSVDILVEAFDKPEMKGMLVNSFLSEYSDRPVVSASGLAGYASPNHIATRQLGKNLFIVGDLKSAAQPGWGLMAPRVGVAAHHEACKVLELILGEARE